MKNLNEGITILPTGECFEDCTLKFVQMLQDPGHRANPDFFLVHGICRMKNGRLFSHAWLELDGKAIESGLRSDTGEKLAVIEPVGSYHQRMQVEEFTRYTWEEAFETAAKHNDMPPPWDEKYRRLTRDHQRQQRNRRKRANKRRL